MNEEIRADRGHYERALLIGVQFPQVKRSEVREHLDELKSLVTTLGVEVAGTEIVRIQRPSPQYLIGKGRAEEIATRLEALDSDLLVFDDDLAAPQQHLWESLTKRAVIDRRKAIIDIFAQRAHTREARLQVDLARLEYTLPRLKRAWTHLERQRGGGGFIGGAGEAQIEVDRRLVRDKIAKLRREIEVVQRHRANQRKAREHNEVPTAALVGYTNSGKSSLLNALTGAGVLQEDKLFATLDPTTRRFELPNNQSILLTDTVGFIRKLPPSLVEAFKSTLEEAVEADILLHVVDCSHPKALEHCRVTHKVLDELGAGEKPMLLVLNKADLLEDVDPVRHFVDVPGRPVVVSAHTGRGIGDLANALAGMIAHRLTDLHLHIPNTRYDVVSSVYRDGEVLEERHESSGVRMHVLFPDRLVPRVQQFATAPW